MRERLVQTPLGKKRMGFLVETMQQYEAMRRLRPYVSPGDVGLDKQTFLRFVADRINDDLKHATKDS